MEEMKRNFLIQNGVDVDKGIENTMDFETYNELLIDFCDTFVDEVNKFNAFKISGDMVNYEIIVHDDASTDNTASIIKQYSKKYPNLIIPILEKENQYSIKKPWKERKYILK